MSSPSSSSQLEAIVLGVIGTGMVIAFLFGVIWLAILLLIATILWVLEVDKLFTRRSG